MKKGAPINAVTTPIGNAESVFKFLAIKSQKTKKLLQKRIQEKLVSQHFFYK